MHRAVEWLGGGILGFIAGSFLCAPVLAHAFGPTRVTWDTSPCPAGIYTITSTATSLDGGRSYTATTAHIRLPQGSIVQEFSDLPAGQYVVTAIARDARGRVFNSDTQNISGLGPSRGRMVQAATAQSGYATSVSRPVPIKAAAPSLSDSRPADVRSETLSTALPAEHEFRLSGQMAELLTGAPGGEPGLLAIFPQWKSVVFVDDDGDGVVDEVRIEFASGEVWVASIGR